MNKIRNLAIKISTPIALAISTVSVYAQTAVTPPDVSTLQVTKYTLDKAWAQVGIYVNWAVALVGIASIVFLMYGAYMYMSAGQNEEHLKKAKATVIYGVIGAVVAVLAFSVFTIAKNLIGG